MTGLEGQVQSSDTTLTLSNSGLSATIGDDTTHTAGAVKLTVTSFTKNITISDNSDWIQEIDFSALSAGSFTRTVVNGNTKITIGTHSITLLGNTTLDAADITI